MLSHILPLSRSGAVEVLLISDEIVESLHSVRWCCPPTWLKAVIGRAGAKLIVTLWVCLRFRPDLVMGYHIFPGALTALLAARIAGRCAVYQMTGGPIEIAGGGVGNENTIMRRVALPSPALERAALAVTAQFDRVIVRGPRARAFLAERGVDRQVTVIPGTVPGGDAAWSWEQRPWDLAFVGRLTEIKQPGQFVEIVGRVKRALPQAKAIIVGDGPLKATLRAQAERLGLTRLTFAGQAPQAHSILSQSRVFVLTSRSEGLSIALAEAMCAGAVPVVADVGELAELVITGESGYLVRPGNLDEHAERVCRLLRDRAHWQRMSQAAQARARNHCGLTNVAERWRRCFGELIAGWDDGPSS